VSVARARNIAALRSHAPSTADALEAAQTRSDVTIREARSGAPALVISHEARPRWLHSRVDPDREAQRLCDTLPGHSGFVVVFGLGAGHHIRRLLYRNTVQRVIVCEPDPSLAAAALDIPQLEQVFADERVTWHLSRNAGTLADLVGSEYVPLLHRQAAVLPLRGRTDLEPARFGPLQQAARDGIERALSDFATQRAFGHRWMHNILVNMSRIRRRVETLPGYGPHIVTAAGPSLERALSSHEALRGATLVATDSSLPMLLQRGITPDFVVTIDSQIASYHHFVSGMPRNAVLVADITASPNALRQAHWVDLRIGSHPFAAYLGTHWTQLPELFTAAGSVTHAAVAFVGKVRLSAESRPAERPSDSDLVVFGADFAYPDAAPYARESYIHRHARLTASRLAPTEHYLASFVYRRARLGRKDADAKSLPYEAPLMNRYKYSFEQLVSRLDLKRKEQVPPDADRARPSRSEAQDHTTHELPDPESFLRRYRQELSLLPPLPNHPTLELFPADQGAELWRTVSPLAAATARMEDGAAVPSESPASALNRARSTAITMLDRILETMEKRARSRV